MTSYKEKQTKSVTARLFRIFGMLLVGLVLLCSVPSALPRIMGFQIYQIVSGSMEPKISVGSAVYAKTVDPISLQAGDIAVFEMNDTIIVHRVVDNHTDFHTITTKGDANEAEDMFPIEYDKIIGKVVWHLPYLGNIMVFFTSMAGKLYLFCMLLVGVLCQLIAYILDHMNSSQIGSLSSVSDSPIIDNISPKKKQLTLMRVVAVILGISFLIVIGTIGKVQIGYQKERNHNQELAKQVVSDVQLPDAEEQNCPISIDFQALQQVNPDIVGWIYCEDTVINYPICHTLDDDYYLTHAYDGTVSKSGAIFMETANESDFSDTNMILYGHHMKDKSMFASLSNWADQDYYEKHPVMWLLTPESTYMIDLYAGYTTSATSDTYTVFKGYGEIAEAYVQKTYGQSDFTSHTLLEEILPDSNEDPNYIVLSTCEYTFENARYVLHGKLLKK